MPGSARHAREVVCLAECVPTALARRTAFLWSALSSACHHHPYDLAPTVGELQGWIEEAEDVVGRLGELARAA